MSDRGVSDIMGLGRSSMDTWFQKRTENFERTKTVVRCTLNDRMKSWHKACNELHNCIEFYFFYIRQTGTVFVCGAWSKIVVRSWTYTVIEATTPKQIVLFDKYLQ